MTKKERIIYLESEVAILNSNIATMFQKNHDLNTQLSEIRNIATSELETIKDMMLNYEKDIAKTNSENKNLKEQIVKLEFELKNPQKYKVGKKLTKDFGDKKRNIIITGVSIDNKIECVLNHGLGLLPHYLIKNNYYRVYSVTDTDNGETLSFRE